MTKIVGILNITPDSFSDGGKFNSLDCALAQLEKMLREGADLVDIGAESTRPTATPISPQEEWNRLEIILPSIIQKVKEFSQNSSKKIKTCIDSYHFSTIQKAFQAGIEIINDVKGLNDQKIIDFIAEKEVPTILMHNSPLKINPELIINPYLDTNRQIINWAENKITQLEKAGIKKSNLIFDPGIGFNKNAYQSIIILKNIHQYKSLNLPIYVGHSKKSFLAKISLSNLNPAQKTLLLSKYLIDHKVDLLRVHDIKEHKLLTNPL